MGQYCYLINKEKKIRTEAYKLSGGGEDCISIEESEKLAKFMEYCRTNKLTIECVSEHYFNDGGEFENSFEDFIPDWVKN